MSTIKTGTTLTTAYQVEGDTTGKFVVQTGSTPTTAMTIDTSQNVGIGTSSPSQKLHVSGGLLQVTRNTQNMFLNPDYNAGGTTSALVVDTGKVLAFMQADTERACIDSSGNVGVGTSTPSTPLSGARGIVINGGAINDVQLRLQNNNTGVTAIDGILLSLAGDNSGYFWNYENAPLIFGTNSTERMRIDSSGRVTMPYQPAFYAWGNSSQSWSGAAAYQILQLNSQASLGSRITGYNTGTYTFTAPVAGTYVFFGRMTTTTGASGPSMSLFKNGSGVNNEMSIGYSTAYMTNGGFSLVQLAAGDAVTLRVVNYNSVSFTLELGRCAFAGWLIG